MKIPDDEFDCYESRGVCRLSSAYLAAVRKHNMAMEKHKAIGAGIEGDQLLADIAVHEAFANALHLQAEWIRAVDAFTAAMKAEETGR